MDYTACTGTELYHEMCRQRDILAGFFPDTLGYPGLVVYRQAEGAPIEDAINSAMLICPHRHEQIEDAIKKISPDFSGEQEFMSNYDAEDHIIYFNRLTPFPDYTLSEEITHSLVRTDRNLIPLLYEEIANFNGIKMQYGTELALTMNSVPDRLLLANINEFFPPLGQTLLLGYGAVRNCVGWTTLLDKIKSIPRHKAEYRFDRLSDILYHIPRMACEALLEHYGGDTMLILKNHHDLFTLDGFEIWYNYCRPILSEGVQSILPKKKNTSLLSRHQPG